MAEDQKTQFDPEVVKTWEAKIAKAEADLKTAQDRVVFMDAEARKAFISRDEVKQSARESQSRLEQAEARLAAMEEYQRSQAVDTGGDPNDPETMSLRTHNRVLAMEEELKKSRYEVQVEIQRMRIENAIERAKEKFPNANIAEVILQVQANPKMEIMELAKSSHDNVEKGRAQWIADYQAKQKAEADAEAQKKAAAAQFAPATSGILPPMPEAPEDKILSVEETFDRLKAHIRENQERLL